MIFLHNRTIFFYKMLLFRQNVSYFITLVSTKIGSRAVSGF